MAQVSRMPRLRLTPRVALLMLVLGAAGASDADADADVDADVADVVVDSADMPVGWGGEGIDDPGVVESAVKETLP